jgi:hypothetical protein
MSGLTRVLGMKRLRGVGVALVFGIATLPLSAHAQTADQLAVCKAWSFTGTKAFTGGTQFNDVSGTSSTDVWAVGFNNTTPIIGHWDGTSWRSVAPDDTNTALYDVVALSSDNAWAAGEHTTRNFADIARILHWDGTGWKPYPAPTGGTVAFLYGISASSADDVWAVGSTTDGQGLIHGLTLHFDGSGWTQIPAVDAGPGTVFYSVADIGPDDAWAVGYEADHKGNVEPVSEHWDGSMWSLVPTPRFPGGYSILYSVSGTGSNDVWAVGTIGPAQPPTVEHWDGSQWNLVQPAGSPGRIYGFLAVEAIAQDDVWIVGQSVAVAGSPAYPASEHWDGTKWSLQGMWVPIGAGSALYGVTSTSPTDIWGVGYYTTDNGYPLAEHSNGSC